MGRGSRVSEPNSPRNDGVEVHAVKEMNELLQELPRSSSVAIIHPADLQKELFTDTVRKGNSNEPLISCLDSKSLLSSHHLCLQ